MRKGLPDNCITATNITAESNVTQVLTREFSDAQRGGLTILSFEAALKIASDLADLCAARHGPWGFRRR
jgi:hypothetical protein